MENSPCYKCEERNVDCHSYCDRYIDWRRRKDIERDKIFKVKECEWLYVSHRKDTADKLSRDKRGGKRVGIL